MNTPETKKAATDTPGSVQPDCSTFDEELMEIVEQCQYGGMTCRRAVQKIERLMFDRSSAMRERVTIALAMKPSDLSDWKRETRLALRSNAPHEPCGATTKDCEHANK